MKLKLTYAAIALILSSQFCHAQEKCGAIIPWTTYEAEHMKTDGKVIGPKYDPHLVETESSGQRCVKLGAAQFVEFHAIKNGNSMVIRYSLPDKKEGGGLNASLAIYTNGKLTKHAGISSRYAWMYGKYPFTNDPSAGQPRHFYDEINLKDIAIAKGDVIRILLEKPAANEAEYCILDLVDLEEIAPALKQPVNSISVTDISFRGDTTDDYTDAFTKCIAKAAETGKTVWIPTGNFKITGDLVIPGNITIQGAGMWHTTLVGDEALYTNAGKRVRIRGNGSNIHLSDFAIDGKLKYRSDNEGNDGIAGSYGSNSTISRLWIEHTKVGIWVENSRNLKITGCRMRNTIADGINLWVGMEKSTVYNCTARGTGDDCFAIWPAVFGKQLFNPGQNLITHCTAQLAYLANGAAIYGGADNKISACSFSDISQGSAILLSTTFPTENKTKGINNNFSGTTVVENCDIKTSGGFDHEWGWRGAIEICLDKREISGIRIKDLNITGSLSNAVSIIAKNAGDQIGILSHAMLQNITVTKNGIATSDKHGLFISGNAHGSLVIKGGAIGKVKNDAGQAFFRILF